MQEYTANYISNAARMIGFAMGGTQHYLDVLKWQIKNAHAAGKLSREEHNGMMVCIEHLEKKQAIINIWWEKRNEENVTPQALEAEINRRGE
jgi:hypothetical protein